VSQVELHAARLPKSWGNRTAAFSHFFGEMAKQQYRVANHEINFRKVDWYTQFKTVRCQTKCFKRAAKLMFFENIHYEDNESIFVSIY